VRRISRDKVQAAGVLVGGLLLLVGMVAVLTTDGAQPDGWTPEVSLLQSNAIGVGPLGAPTQAEAAVVGADRASDAEAPQSNADALASAETAHRQRDAELQRQLEVARDAEQREPAKGLLSGLVTDAAGAPVADALVEVTQRRRRGRGRRDRAAVMQGLEVRTDAMGRFTAEVLAGQVMAWASADGFARSDLTPTVVEPDGETDLGTLIVRTACSLSGRVLTTDGLPLPGAEVRVPTSRVCSRSSRWPRGSTASGCSPTGSSRPDRATCPSPSNTAAKSS
jgi:protocatechuate 3,4-dioxygenase beta subunit